MTTRLGHIVLEWQEGASVKTLLIIFWRCQVSSRFWLLALLTFLHSWGNSAGKGILNGNLVLLIPTAWLIFIVQLSQKCQNVTYKTVTIILWSFLSPGKFYVQHLKHFSRSKTGPTIRRAVNLLAYLGKFSQMLQILKKWGISIKKFVGILGKTSLYQTVRGNEL